LLVANPNCSSTISHYLSLIPALPIANFDANEYEDCAPLEVYFENNSQYGDTYEWDFGDGNTSTEREPSHIFTEPGYYNVSLTVTGDGGVRHYFRVFQVFENPEADFVIAPREVMLPDARVHMYSKSRLASQYVWDLGDGTIRTTRDVVHTYTAMGEYRVTLTVFSEYGCEDTKSEYPAVWVKGGGRIRFPNAFVPSKLGPNGGVYDEVDFKNEVFHPVTEAVVEYRLLIFNRWGEQIFQSDDIKIGWDGYYNGKLCSQDVYVWRAIGKYSNGKTFDLRGNVSLLR
jgi:gliding motility-associated-like protein